MEENEIQFEIPKEKLHEGIKLCFDKAYEIMDSAVCLLQNNWTSPDVITGLISLALEEFGKALMLKDILTNNDEEVYIIPQKFFRTASAHFQRIDRGLQEIPKEKRDFYPSLLNKLYNDPEIKIEKKGNQTTYKIPRSKIKKFKNLNSVLETISLSSHNPEILESTQPKFPIRMLCFHVDWDSKNEKWKTGVPHAKKQLSELISILNNRIKELSEPI